MVSTLNGNTSYTCFAQVVESVNIIWTLDGTPLEELNLSNVRTDIINTIGILAIFHLTEEFNGTIIQCKSRLRSGAVVYSSTSELNVLGMFYQGNIHFSSLFQRGP